MNFESRSALAEHIKQLVKDGYLFPLTITDTIGGKTHVKIVYTVNFERIKEGC